MIGVALFDSHVAETGALAVIWTDSGITQMGAGLKAAVDAFGIAVPKIIFGNNQEGLIVRLTSRLAKDDRLIRPLRPDLWQDLAAVRLALTRLSQPLITVDYNFSCEQWSVNLNVAP